MKGNLLEVRTYGDPVLRAKSVEIGEVTEEITVLAKDMVVTMLDEDGIGLAAPQVGRNLRMFTLGLNAYDSELPPNASPGERMLWEVMPCAIINPVIKEVSSVTSVMEEGCLSIPGINAEVVRPADVELEGTIILEKSDKSTFKKIQFQCSNLLSTCLQHEIDHLDGILFVDRASAEEKKMIKKSLKKLEKNTLKKLSKR